MSIPEALTRIKVTLDDGLSEWGIVTMVLLVGLASFGLGRLSALEDVRPPVAIRQAPSAQNPAPLALGGQFVASRQGGSYYYPWCAGAAKIAPSNQVWFISEDTARRAGYSPAKNCKGLVQ